MTRDEEPSTRLAKEADLAPSAPHALRVARADEVRARGWTATPLLDDHWLALIDVNVVSG